MNNSLYYPLLFVVLVLLQITIFGHIQIMGVMVPMVFIYFILKLPMAMSVISVLTVSFLLGLTIDVCSDTLGMNALGCTVVAFARRPVLSVYAKREEDILVFVPSVRKYGLGLYASYAATLSFIYCVVVYAVDSFTVFGGYRFFLGILGSTALTFIAILCIESLTGDSSGKRL